LLHFTYNESDKKFAFKQQFDFDLQLDLLVRVLNNFYLLVFIDQNSEPKFTVKKLVNDQVTKKIFILLSSGFCSKFLELNE
jgi:hypothetical protein